MRPITPYVIPLLLAACGGSPANPPTPPTPQASAAPCVCACDSASAAAPAPSATVAGATPQPPIGHEKPIVTPTIPTRTLQIVQTINVGKWPEGLALSGQTVWVAESGQRQLAKIDLQKGVLVTHANVGRLPVDMLTGPDDSVYALERTEQVVRLVNTKGVMHEFSRLPDYPQGMALENDALWVLLWDEGSSGNSTVVRIDLKTKKQKRSPKLGPNAWQIAEGFDSVWVGHETRISVLDKSTLQKKADISLIDAIPAENSQKRTEFGRVAVGPRGVYGDYDLSVVRIDPQKMAITQRKRLGQLPLYMVVMPNDLWVATREGSIWQLDPETLAVRAEHKSSKPLDFHDLKFRDGLFYVTEHPGPEARTEDGWLRILKPDIVVGGQ